MSTVNIDAKLLKALEDSTCFGIAHSETVPECKQCDVKGQCKAKSEGAVLPTPSTKPKKESASAKKETAPKPKKETTSKPKADKPKKEAKPKAPAKEKPAPSGDLPDFKPMTLDELKAMAAERSVDWKDYGNDQITRMRLIMNLKKSF